MVLVKQELSQARGSSTLEAGDHVPDLLDGFYLFIKELVFQHLAKVGIIILASITMKLQQALIDLFFEIKSSLESIMGIAPLLLAWSRDGLQHDPSSTLVLVLHQNLGMIPLFITGLFEELLHPWESNIVPIEVVTHGQVNIAGIEFHVDLLVDGGLALLMVVLADLAAHLGGW